MISDLVIGMEMIESEGGLSTLEVRMGNWASFTDGDARFAFEDDALLRLGASMAVYAGDEESPQQVFAGVISGLEAEFSEDAPPELIVLAEDKLQNARMARRTQVYVDVSLADVAGQIATRLGLNPVVDGFTDDIGTWVQLNESDLAFLRRILARHFGDVQVVGGELHVSPQGEVRRGVVELELFSQLQKVRVLADLAHQVTEVTVSGWDALQGARVSATSTGHTPGPGSGRSGSQVLASALGDRSEHIGHLAVATDAEAQALADAAFDRRRRRFVRVYGTTEGNPAVRVGTHVSLTGLGPRFSNTYYVVGTCHRYDLQRGYETDFEAECAFMAEG